MAGHVYAPLLQSPVSGLGQRGSRAL